MRVWILWLLINSGCAILYTEDEPVLMCVPSELEKSPEASLVGVFFDGLDSAVLHDQEDIVANVHRISTFIISSFYVGVSRVHSHIDFLIF